MTDTISDSDKSKFTEYQLPGFCFERVAASELPAEQMAIENSGRSFNFYEATDRLPERESHSLYSAFQSTAMELGSHLTAFLWLAGYTTIYFEVWRVAYRVIAPGWTMRIADSPVTVGALFVGFCIYFWMQIILYKAGKIYRAGLDWGNYFCPAFYAGCQKLGSDLEFYFRQK